MDSIYIKDLHNPFNEANFISDIMIDKNIDIEFVYGSDFKNAKILRDFVEVICFQLWFQHKDISRFILIIDELNNNAIEHWSEIGWENKIRIKSVNKWDSIDIIIEVEDTWKWNKPKTALEMETLRAHQLRLWYWNHESIRWRGLFMIIVKSVDRLYFKETDLWGLIVWIKKNVKI